jgi:hypothetical protein
VAAHCRSAANLARLTKTEALPIESALREKFEALHRETEKLLSSHSRKHLG